jgi:uncharacterized membrane protein
MLALGALIGCSGGSSGTSEKHAGGPGAATSASQKAPVVGESEGTFDLSPPSTAVHVKQGETKEVRIDIKRGKNFDKDVALKFADVPKDVEVKPADPVIKHGDTGVVLMITAKDTAAVGDFKVKVTGHPTEGKDAAETLEIKVSAK